MLTLLDSLCLCLAATTILLAYYRWSFTYWSRRNLEFLPPSIPFGNLENPAWTKKSQALIIKDLYSDFKKKQVKHAGVYFFARPMYMVLDLNRLKNLMTRDFRYFTDRGSYHNEKNEPLEGHLFAVGGQKWRDLRIKLTPTFTSGKMRMMFQTLLDCEKSLQNKMKGLERNVPIDIKEILSSFTIDVIGSCAFGMECNSFKDDNSPFKVYGKKAFHPNRFRRLLTSFVHTFPGLARAMNLRVVAKEVTDFYMKVVRETVDHRERNNFTRKDFLQLLIDLKNSGKDEESLTLEEVAAQCFIFFLAGFESSSSAMTFALYELAKHQEIQQQLRNEIETVLAQCGGTICYDAINQMKYMSQVLNETLRKHPPLPFITRVCVKDYNIPEENVTIEKGTKVIIPIMGIHHDEEYYPNPEQFDPTRFQEENLKSRHSFAYIPFGEGPRICIGLRFAVLQTKIALTSLLRKYKFTLNSKTQEPLTYNTNAILLSAEGDIWLDATEIVL